MGQASISDRDGDNAVAALLRYEGWEVIGRQVDVHGHSIDLVCELDGEEVLVEVKVWARDGGKDTVKKAIADAYDLQACGETRPYVLILSHNLAGLYRDMLHRAMGTGAITRVRVLTFEDLS